MSEDDTTVVNTSADQEATASTDSTTDEYKEPEATDTSEETDESEAEDTEQSEDTDDDTQSDEIEQEDQEQHKGAEARKQQLNTEIRDLVATRNQLQQQVESLNSQAYPTNTPDELLNEVNPATGEYYNQLEAQVEIMRQERELERYNAQVVNTQMAIDTDAQRALQDFPRFDPQSPEYDKEAASNVAQILQSALQYDQRTGQLIGSNIPIYQLYQSHELAAQSSARRAEIKGQKSTEKMISSADRPTGGAGKPTPFNKLGSIADMEAQLRKKGHDV